jgi:phosphoribosylanthranilate isomerase
MTKVKICGITHIDDALHAADCGADALGFIFYQKSPRCLTPEAAQEIIGALPPFITVVGLFVNEVPERVRRVADFCGLDVLQLHGEELPGDCFYPPRRVVKALRVRDETSLAGMADFAVSAFLLDAWAADSYGGTGHTFNWDLAAGAARRHRVILAGGLTPGNVAEAVAAVGPYAVDVSSGVETAPGKKDPGKVEAFIRNAKAVSREK